MIVSTSKPAFLSILTLFLSVLLSTLSFSSTALASPIAVERALSKRYSGTPAGKQGDGGPDTSDYPSDDEIRAAFIAPSGPFVFFSGLPNPQTNQAPYQFSQTIDGAQILRNAFPKSYINQRYKPNPERSIQWYQDFLDRVSGIYADKAVEKGEKVYFVGKYDATVLDCSIWKRIEMPTLTDAGIPITLVDYSNFDNKKDYPGTEIIVPFASRSLDGDSNALAERGTGVCFDWPGNQDDPNDPDADPPVGIPYYPGSCGVHLQQVSLLTAEKTKGSDRLPILPHLHRETEGKLTVSPQYQKNEGQPASNGDGGTSDYRFTIQLKDANQELVGEVDYYDAPGGQGVGVTSQLPLVFIATAGDVDDDPVKFAYGDQSWDSNSEQCSVGKYDSGSRQMDCGFTC